MPCSVCRKIGHNKKTCNIKLEISDENNTNKSQKINGKTKEVQSHGFLWEKDILKHVYGAQQSELNTIKYNNKIDLPSQFNRLDKVDLLVKTTGKVNSICMADCLSLYDLVSSNKPLHLVVIHYKQTNSTKKIIQITEVNLTGATKQLFGTLKRDQIEILDKMIKSIPQKRKPTLNEYLAMYELKKQLQTLSKAIRLDIKCNSQQSRLQCSFNKFSTFIKMHPERIITTSSNNEFRGGKITDQLLSSKRKFNKIVSKSG